MIISIVFTKSLFKWIELGPSAPLNVSENILDRSEAIRIIQEIRKIIVKIIQNANTKN
jgi:hypothetical protein